MGHVVTSRKKDGATLDRACEAVMAARYVTALEVIDAAAKARALSSDGVLLRARIELRDSPEDALATLARHRPILRGAAASATAAMLRGAAFARLGDARSSSASLREAASAVACDSALGLEIAYQRAAALWIARKLDAAERALAPVAGRPGDVGVRAAILRGVIAAARGDVPAQAAILLETVAAARAADVSTHTRAALASQLGVLARALPSRALQEAAAHEASLVLWTPEIGGLHVAAIRSLAWVRALEGDHFEAFRRLREAARVAPGGAWLVTILCDRAYLAGALGESRWAEQELSDARELAEGVDWGAARGEERLGLVGLAELFAPRDLALALTLEKRYRALGPNPHLASPTAGDRRVVAFESHAFAVVRAAHGERGEAVRLATEAYEIHASYGYEWLAGRSALLLAGLTGDPVWRERASERLRAYPRSWLVAPVARHLPDIPELAKLTPAQRTVLDLIVRGKSTVEIAATLGRSEFTVRNHIKAIFKAFDVNARPALVARVVGTAT